MPLSPNQKLGAYEIVCSLGAGGMGEVYRARDSRLGRDVALKVLPPDVTSEPGRLERFDREARAIAALNHPHIVTIYSTEEADGIRFLTMEVVDGCTLCDLVMPGGMAIPKFLEIALPLADALAAAHHKHITHRDLKPGNVMVSNDGRVKVLDFGLARVGGGATAEETLIATAAPITHRGMIVGTMPYMSPEQVEGRPLDPRTDLFSLGVIFYELLSGNRPFAGSSSAALMSAILRDTPAKVSEQRPEIPEALDHLLSRLLEKRPEDRVQTARDVVNELRHIKGTGSSTAVRRGLDERPTTVDLTVAVQPFESRSADEPPQGLADGLCEEVANGLSRFGYLKVLAGANAVAQARYTVGGQVRKVGQSIRVSVKLTDAVGGATLWAENYDANAGEEFFALQDSIASRVVATVGDETGVLMRSMAASIAHLPIDQLSVAELVVRYHMYAQDFRPDGHAVLRSAFEHALQREPRAAEGWACLAMLCEHEYGFGYNSLPDTLERHRQAAEKAVALDPRSQHAWSAMASVHLFARDVPAVRAAVDRVAALNPLNADLVARTALFLDLAGDHDRALALTNAAIALKPQHPPFYHFVPFNACYARGDDERALVEAQLLWMPKLPVANLGTLAVAGQLGRAAEARVAFDALRKIDPQLVNADVARQLWGRWVCDAAFLERLVDGFTKALALLDAAQPFAAGTRPPSSSSGVTSREASIAVMPFADLSERKDQDWFCDGIAEEILNALAPLPGLRVAARASAFSVRGKGDDLRSIGAKLNVSTVLEGSVRRAGDRVRITAQLSDAQQARQLWSERFDREMKDIFDVQEEIARAIVERLKLTIRHDASGRLVQKTTTNIEAYQLLLKGRELLLRRGPAIFDAIPSFERVIALDPEVAEAHALLGDAHRLTGLYGLVIATTAMPRAVDALRRALEIDPNQIEALATIANITGVYDWDVAGALALSDRALARDPSHVRSHAERAISMAAMDGSASIQQRALADIARARALDPLNAWVMAIEALCVAMLGRPEPAVDLARGAVMMDGNNFSARWALLSTLAWCGRDAEARETAAAALAMSGRHPRLLAELAAIHAAHGERDAAVAIHDELRARAHNHYVGFAEQAVVAAAAGEMTAARGLLAQAIAARDPYLTFWKLPSWRLLWQDAECRARLRDIPLTKPISG